MDMGHDIGRADIDSVGRAQSGVNINPKLISLTQKQDVRNSNGMS
jgi:hypothetical protein